MIHRALQRVFAASLGAASLFGCNATETGNPVAGQTLALTARSSSDDVATGSTEDAALSVSSAWIVLGDMRFIQSADCDSGSASRVDVDGPIAIDLVKKPDVLDLELAATRYCRVRVRLDKAKDVAGAPSVLDDHSIVLEGERADGVSFSVRSRRNFDLELRARGDGFSLGTGKEAMILAFDVATWLDGVDLESATPDSNGSIAVDDDSDRDRLDVFEDNVKQAMELFKDDNRDSKLDRSELEDLLASGSGS